MQIDIDELINKGYNLLQINQILLADEESGNFLKILNTDTPVDVFRDIRINFKTYSDEQRKELFNKYCCGIPFTIGEISDHSINAIILGKSGSGKSFSSALHPFYAMEDAEDKIIVTDPKGEIRTMFREYLKKTKII